MRVHSIFGAILGVLLGCAVRATPLPPSVDPLDVTAAAPRFAWVQGSAVLTFPIATSPSTANSYVYTSFFTLSSAPTGTALSSALTPTTCVAAPTGGGSVCTGTIVTLPPDGTYNIQVTSKKTVGTTTKESPKSAAWMNQDIVQPPVTPGAPSSCAGCTPAPVPLAIAFVTPAENATMTGITDVTFDTTGALVRGEATVLDAADVFICTCQASQVTGAATGAQRWRVQLDTPQAVNATYKILAAAYTATGTPVSTVARTVAILN